jgi:hypothetical protein
MTSSILHNNPKLTLEDINAPVRWCCVDCGKNTAPGCPTRQQIFDAYQTGQKRLDAVLDTNSEVYTVRPAIWKKARMEPFGGCLCIGCLEKRLGRQLKPKDFDQYHLLNGLPGTPLLIQRRGKGSMGDWRLLDLTALAAT